MEKSPHSLTSDPTRNAARIQQFLERFIFLRHKFKANLPENVEAFRSQVLEDNLSGKASDHFFLLGFLISRQGEPISMSEISRAMGIPLSTTTRVVDWFVRNGYATRLQTPEDRRIVRIALSASGAEIYQAMNGYMVAQAERILSQLEPADRDTLAQIMEKLIVILDKEKVE
jgi:DNA-binding MarR family transcriptional regulator